MPSKGFFSYKLYLYVNIFQVIWNYQDSILDMLRNFRFYIFHILFFKRVYIAFFLYLPSKFSSIDLTSSFNLVVYDFNKASLLCGRPLEWDISIYKAITSNFYRYNLQTHFENLTTLSL